MAIRLVRSNSNTPNVLNSDDARMMRYCSGGYNGVTKNYGYECAYSIDGNVFTIKSGEIIIDGWQAVIDGAGISITINNITGTQYYKIFAEIDLSNPDQQVCNIKSQYDTYAYPIIAKGDDLSISPLGKAAIELYTLLVIDGVISSVMPLFITIQYDKDRIPQNAYNTTTVQNVNLSSFSPSKFGEMIVEKKVKIYESTNWLSFYNDHTLNLTKSINKLDKLEIDCTIQQFSVNMLLAISGRIIITDYSSNSALFYPMLNNIFNGKQVGVVKVEFRYLTQNTIRVQLSNQGFEECAITNLTDMSNWKIRVDKVYKIYE